MIFGRLAKAPKPDFSDLPEYSPPDTRPELGVSRRHWLTAAVGLGFGLGAVTASVLSVGGEPARAGERPGGKPVDVSQLPQWAREMLERPPEQVLQNAGNYEMAGARHHDDPRLVPCFERLLDIAIESSAPEADEAGACAVRALERLRNVDHLGDRFGAILVRKRLRATREAAMQAFKTVHQRRDRGK